MSASRIEIKLLTLLGFLWLCSCSPEGEEAVLRFRVLHDRSFTQTQSFTRLSDRYGEPEKMAASFTFEMQFLERTLQPPDTLFWFNTTFIRAIGMIRGNNGIRDVNARFDTEDQSASQLPTPYDNIVGEQDKIAYTHHGTVEVSPTFGLPRDETGDDFLSSPFTRIRIESIWGARLREGMVLEETDHIEYRGGPMDAFIKTTIASIGEKEIELKIMVSYAGKADNIALHGSSRGRMVLRRTDGWITRAQVNTTVFLDEGKPVNYRWEMEMRD